MPSDSRWMPYAPPATVLQVLHHYRQREVPEKLLPGNLIQLGVPESLVPRTLSALQFLKLIEEDGLTTERFKALRFANDDDYKHVFGDILQAAYKEIFDFVNPAEASESAIRNAFHPFSPGGQRSRMITLFLGLCQEAGIPLKQTPKQSATRVQRSKPNASRSTADRKATKIPPSAEPPAESWEMRGGFFGPPTGQIDPALTALFRKVPISGQPWPEFNIWLDALKATVALTNPTPPSKGGGAV
jgi:Family of unknown function (DUF5343)